MATPQWQQRQVVQKPRFKEQAEQFWQRVTEGLAISDLWSQFRRDATSSYQLYSKEVDRTRVAGVPHSTHFLQVASQYFWAIIEKLTPARRVLLLVALVLVFLPGGEWIFQTQTQTVKIGVLDFHFWGGLLMFVLLILEVGDRVVMKRDLDCEGNSILAFTIRTAEGSRARNCVYHAPRQHRRRRLLRRFRPSLRLRYTHLSGRCGRCCGQERSCGHAHGHLPGKPQNFEQHSRHID
jgi:hypothetical protein